MKKILLSIITITFLIAYVSTIKVNAKSYSSSQTTRKYISVDSGSQTDNLSNTGSSNSSNATVEENKGGIDLSGILGGLTDIPNKIKEAFLNPLNTYFQARLLATKIEVDGAMSVFKNLLTKDDLNSSTFRFAKSLWNALKPIGYSLIGLFFIVDFCRKTIYFEVMNPLEIIKSVIKLVLTKTLVDQSYTILSMVLGINRMIVNTVFAIAGNSSLSDIINLNQLIKTDNTSIDLVQIISEKINSQFFLLLIGVLLVICIVIVNLRNIELAVLAGLAPIFFATNAGEISNDVFKSYLKNFISVAAQTIWMSVGLAFLTSGYVGTVTGAGGLFSPMNLLIGMLTLTLYVIKAPNSIKSALGGSGTSANVSLSSLAMLIK